MKNAFTLLFLFASAMSGFAQTNAVSDSLDVKVTGHKKVAGSSFYIAVVDANNQELDGLVVALKGDEEEVYFRLPTKGAEQVAVRMFQDLDGDEEMDRSTFGIPSEPFGFSNNPEINFGPPSLKKMLVNTRENNRIHIVMQ